MSSPYRLLATSRSASMVTHREPPAASAQVRPNMRISTTSAVCVITSTLITFCVNRFSTITHSTSAEPQGGSSMAASADSSTLREKSPLRSTPWEMARPTMREDCAVHSAAAHSRMREGIQPAPCQRPGSWKMPGPSTLLHSRHTQPQKPMDWKVSAGLPRWHSARRRCISGKIQ